MKHLLITLEYPPQRGGIATYLFNLARQFSRDQITIIASECGDCAEFDVRQSQRIIRYPDLSRWKSGIVALLRLIKKLSPDHIIISHILPMGYVALLSGRPFTVILHGMDIRLAQKTRVKKMMAKCILRKAHTIIVNSNDTLRALQSCGDFKNKIIQAYPCPNTFPQNIDSAREQEIFEKYFKGKYAILSVNRLVKRKGNDMTLRAIALLKEKIPELSYIAIGSGPEKESLQTLAEELGIRDRVCFLENISDADLPLFYRNAKIFVMPARIENPYDVEGFGIAYLEAAQFATPAIAGNKGGAPEAVMDGITGLLVNPRSVEDIAAKIEYLASHEEFRQQLGKAAQDRVMKDFTWEKQLSVYLKRISPDEAL